MRLVRHFDESPGRIYVAVNELEADRRLASALRIVIVAIRPGRVASPVPPDTPLPLCAEA